MCEQEAMCGAGAAWEPGAKGCNSQLVHGQHRDEGSSRGKSSVGTGAANNMP